MSTYKLLIRLANGKKIYLNNVTAYSVNAEKKLIDVTINGYRQFFNFNFVSYIGIADYLEQDDEG